MNAMQSLHVFVVPKNRKRREIALEEKNEQRRNTSNAGTGSLPASSLRQTLDVLRLCSSNSLFLVFDDNYCFLALSASVWTMGKMRDGAQWLSNHYAANDYYCEGEKVVGIMGRQRRRNLRHRRALN